MADHAHLKPVDEPALPYLEQRLTRALDRLDTADHPVDTAVLADADGLLLAAAGDPRHHVALAALAVHPTAGFDRLGAAYAPVAGVALTLGSGHVLEVRDIAHDGMQLATLSRAPVDPALRDRVARELRLLLARA
ncbi:MAG: hypothetical protein KC635_03670 [Myxococcales bacterium]|nr:hypothetical protein [Myxococcales bacterium]MCB9731966.1 hypothetical protein [Deltaproteobacteria bacterium]